MASPARKYPTVLIANKLDSHTLHDTTEIAAPVVGFIADQDGSFSARLRGDTADVTLNVLGGLFYPFDIKLAKATSASGVTALRILRFNTSA
jgi:hypothetical protein